MLFRHAHITGCLHIRQGQDISSLLLLGLQIPHSQRLDMALHVYAFRLNRHVCSDWD